MGLLNPLNQRTERAEAEYKAAMSEAQTGVSPSPPLGCGGPENFTNIDFIFFCVGLPKGQLTMPRKLPRAFRAGQSATPSASWESTFIL